MKKGLLFTVALCSVVLLSGCGAEKEQKLTCTLTKNDVITGYNMTSDYNVTAKGEKVVLVKTKEVVESENSEILDYFEETLNDTYTKMNDAYGGYDFEITVEGQKLVADTTIDYTVLDMEKLTQDDPTMKQLVDENNSMTLDSMQELYETLGATCEKE